MGKPFRVWLSIKVAVDVVAENEAAAIMIAHRKWKSGNVEEINTVSAVEVTAR